MSDIRKKLEQEINAVASGVDSDSLPKDMGILIPSLDLQKSIDRIMGMVTQEKLDLLDRLEKSYKGFPPYSDVADILEVIQKEREGLR
jgi:hypothetical protein